MTNKNYLRFRYYDIIGNFIACTVWFSLASYVVTIKINWKLKIEYLEQYSNTYYIRRKKKISH
jgi:hypothetical protein